MCVCLCVCVSVCVCVCGVCVCVCLVGKKGDFCFESFRNPGSFFGNPLIYIFDFKVSAKK